MARRTIERATDDEQGARGQRGAACAVTGALLAALLAGAGAAACTHPEPKTGSTPGAPTSGEECAASAPAPTALPTLPIEQCKATPRKP